ncbi:LICD family protein [Gemella bergeri ATCC 700627]|uniref:LICD family protein n=1 Tax=Gemella bergeri ATCC 700627 TaxID=1321820 RepID=U2Q0G2_9BACL|nr:LicD family protein [Gemella bergeri]ERK56255.1 LICD family protein [Gemella bergeri ATCC 700627]
MMKEIAKQLTESELKNIQRVLLVILDDIIEICEKNKIDFVLIGGSAIGAVRHQGFIPWDDDIDIAMTREGFEKFIDIISAQYSHKYSMLNPAEEQNYGRVIPKIRLKGTTYRTVLEQDLDDVGVFIDIFIIENVFDNKLLKHIHGIGSLVLGFLLSCRRKYKNKKNDDKNIRKYIGGLISFIRIETLATRYDVWNRMCKNNNSKEVTVPVDKFHFYGEIEKRSDVEKLIPVNFEGRNCYIFSNYDDYLMRRYGNYMKIPPEKERVWNQYIEYDLGKYKLGEKDND